MNNRLILQPLGTGVGGGFPVGHGAKQPVVVEPVGIQHFASPCFVFAVNQPAIINQCVLVFG